MVKPTVSSILFPSPDAWGRALSKAGAGRPQIAKGRTDGTPCFFFCGNVDCLAGALFALQFVQHLFDVVQHLLPAHTAIEEPGGDFGIDVVD